ncbi:MAG TPA: TIGR04211 family SH3 domain-containing protein [Gammaproteobacteria bacterium]|nr:TIGR04211 family SH3 domain-containing protein [Gammaproteobacteria bacterium]
MRTTLALAILLAAATVAAAETAYVTDSLRLGLYADADASGTPSQNLVSGTPLEVLERTQGYARVRTAAGSEGWVKSTYLVDEKPARLRVAELEAELATLRGDADRARAARVNAEDELHRLGKQVATATGSTDAIQDTLGRLKNENETYEARLESYRWSLPLPWVAAALVVALGAGFVSGLWWLDALIRRRHGGFRVY